MATCFLAIYISSYSSSLLIILLHFLSHFFTLLLFIIPYHYSFSNQSFSFIFNSYFPAFFSINLLLLHLHFSPIHSMFCMSPTTKVITVTLTLSLSLISYHVYVFGFQPIEYSFRFMLRFLKSLRVRTICDKPPATGPLWV